MPPILPRIEPSPRSLPPACGAACQMRPARREKGSDCSQTLPGPSRRAKKNPSPPKMDRHLSRLMTLFSLLVALVAIFYAYYWVPLQQGQQDQAATED